MTKRVTTSAAKLFWCSWVQKTEDHRPITFPPNEAILGWWCSGYDSDDNAILCAVVRAKGERDARVAIEKDWPEFKNEDFRFFEERDAEWKPENRFPLNDWMIKRFTK